MAEENISDPQRIKRIATSYDYDRDPRWAECWSNILIPHHLASRSDVIDHFKRNFYQRFILPSPGITWEEGSPSSSVLRILLPSDFEILPLYFLLDPDLVVELMTSTGSSQLANTSVRHASATTSENARPRAAASTTGTSAPPKRNTPIHCVCISVLYIFLLMLGF